MLLLKTVMFPGNFYSNSGSGYREKSLPPVKCSWGHLSACVKWTCMNSYNLVPRELSKTLSRMFQFAGNGAQGLIHPSSNLDAKNNWNKKVISVQWHFLVLQNTPLLKEKNWNHWKSHFIILLTGFRFLEDEVMES